MIHELIDRQEVIKHIEDCLDKNGYVDTTKFAKCMRQIFNMPYESEESIRADEHNKTVNEFARKYGQVETYGCDYCKHTNDNVHCWDCIAEMLKEQK